MENILWGYAAWSANVHKAKTLVPFRESIQTGYIDKYL